ncbi:ATP-binding protein [candidate division KSB1 bacterium]
MAGNNSTEKHLEYQKSINKKHYRDLLWKHFIRLFITYVAPLIILILYFQFQYKSLIDESRSLHIKSIAENISNTLDLFLRERIVNLVNIIDDPRFSIPPTSPEMQSYLEKLQRDSDTFIDIGFFDSTGRQTTYVGPISVLENRDYSNEEWYITLKQQNERFIITDNYLGFRNNPHFTVAVKRLVSNQYVILRSTLEPKKLYEFISSQENPDEVQISVINNHGTYQVVTTEVGSVLENSSTLPPMTINHGIQNSSSDNRDDYYAFKWLNNVKWAVIVKWALPAKSSFYGFRTNIITFSVAIVFAIIAVIIIRSKKLVQSEKEKDIVDAQLEHAAKLASVGELSAGIAHEINNPLAIIASETGLMKDLMNPEFLQGITFNDLYPHIENIREATFRCRDITGKLLSFVRKNDVEIKRYNVHTLLNDIVNEFLGHELYVSNIEITKNYCSGMQEILTDGNQLKQVFLNIINNAVDAIEPPGAITITTSVTENNINIEISDTGNGISQNQIGKIFLPFFTTKEVGKGTGLGLSVSYGIIKNFGGEITVNSIPGKGSEFFISLPKT